jgi:hypothetical protein
MYPGYKPREVLTEYAVTFFAMLNEGYRLEAENMLLQFQLSHPEMYSADDTKALLRQLQFASKEAGDILDSDEEATDLGKLNSILGK